MEIILTVSKMLFTLLTAEPQNKPHIHSFDMAAINNEDLSAQEKSDLKALNQFEKKLDNDFGIEVKNAILNYAPNRKNHFVRFFGEKMRNKDVTMADFIQKSEEVAPAVNEVVARLKSANLGSDTINGLLQGVDFFSAAVLLKKGIHFAVTKSEINELKTPTADDIFTQIKKSLDKAINATPRPALDANQALRKKNDDLKALLEKIKAVSDQQIEVVSPK